MVIQNGVNKKTVLSTLLGSLNSTSNILINPNQASIATIISSATNANMLYVSGANNRVGVGTASPLEMLHVAGNTKVGSNTSDGLFVKSSEYLFAASPTNNIILSVNRESSIIKATGNCTYILNSGTEGQTKRICYWAQGSSGHITITAAAGLGFTQITMNTVGNSILLEYQSDGTTGKWVILGNYGSVLS